MKRANVRFVFDRKKVATKKQKGLVQMEILYDKKRKWVSTGIKVYSDQWNDRQWVVRSLDAQKLNKELFAQKEQLEAFLGSLTGDNPFSWEKVDRWLSRDKEAKSDDFIEFCDWWIEHRKDIRDSTRKTEKKLIASLKEFGVIKYFADLTKKNIIAYEMYLNERYDNLQTRYSYIKFLKTCVNEAMRQERISEDPFLGLKFKRGESPNDRYLTAEDVEKIAKAEMPTKSLSNVRDLLVVQCYTGLAFSDLMNADFTKAVKHGERYVLADERKKTGKGYYIILLSPVMEILKKHNFRLPRMSNQQYNLRLKAVADKAEVDKPITSHWLRRTCGYLLLNNGISIEMVAKMLGHANIQTTQKVYAKILDKTMDKAFNGLEKRMGIKT